jgi:hypothetical protein
MAKFFKEFNGGKTAFEAAGHHDTYANNVVVLKGDSAKGEAPCIYTRGMYFPDAAALIDALAFVKGIQINGVNYDAVKGGGYVKFEAADPATVVYVEKDGVKIGLSSAFVEAHNQVISDVAAIKADYLKASDKQALEKSINDKDAAMKQYVDAEIAKVATSEAFNALTGRVSTLEGEIVTERGRIDGIINTTIPAIEQSVVDAQNASKVTFESTIGEGNNPNVYTFKQGGEQIGQISIAKDLVVKSGAIVELDGVKNLQLTLTNGDVVSVPVHELVDVYTAGDYITIGSDNKISVNKAELLAGLATDENLGKLEVRVKANEDALATVDSRIAAAEGRVDTKLADYAKTADVNAELAKKADQSAMETALGNKADKSELGNYQTVAGMATVLAPYAKTEDVNAALGNKADKSELGNYYKKTETYSQTEINNKFSGVYTKTEADGKFALQSAMETALAGKVDNATLEGYYTKEQVDGIVDDLATADNVYTKGEVDAKIASELEPYAKTTAVEGLVAPKADKSYVDTELGKKANSADVYTKTQVDEMFQWEVI